MTSRQTLLSMTAAAALLAVPVLATAQQGGSSGGGSSMQSTTTQTTPQQGAVSSTPAARAGAEPGGTGPTQGVAQGATGTRDASGGVLAQGGTTGGTAAGTTGSPRDGTPGNPPSTAPQRAVDSVTGNRTPPDGTPGNPPGTAAGRAMDRTLGTNTTGANPGGTSAATGSVAGTTAGAGAGAMAVDSAALRSGRRASKIIGSNIYNENNESIGEVEDILIPPTTASMGAAGSTGTAAMGMAQGPVAIVSVGGFLGIGAKLVAVPYERLQHNAERNRWVLSGATKESLTALPTFSYDSMNTERRSN